MFQVGGGRSDTSMFPEVDSTWKVRKFKVFLCYARSFSVYILISYFLFSKCCTCTSLLSGPKDLYQCITWKFYSDLEIL